MGLKDTLNRTADFLKSFGVERSGGVAMMMGLTMPVIFLGAGGAVDYSNAISTKQKAQSAIDSTVLALTRRDLTTIDVQAEGRELFSAIMQEQGIANDINNVNFTLNNSLISGSAVVDSQNYFLGLIGMDTMAARVEAAAVPPANRPIEIALVLDTSGSMGNDLNGSPRIERMKVAVNEMFDTLDDTLPPGAEVRASLVPYSTSVNISDFQSAAVNSSVAGLPKEPEIWAAERFVAVNGNSFNLNTADPGVSPLPFVTASEMGMNATPATRMAPLTDDIADVRSTVAGMNPSGRTAGHIGMAWGLYSLAESWGGFWPTAPEANGDSEKIIVFLSDGLFNTTHNIGARSRSDGVTSKAYFQDVCSLARDEDITIYTIALALDPASEARLRRCVGSSGESFSASNAAELSAAFKSIASRVGTHRLTS